MEGSEWGRGGKRVSERVVKWKLKIKRARTDP